METTLSNEILEIIFSHLADADDVCNLRLTSRKFASLGLRYLVPRVQLVRMPKAFERLRAIANHPVLSRHVVEIVYYIDEIPDISYDHEPLSPSSLHLLARHRDLLDLVGPVRALPGVWERHERDLHEVGLLRDALPRLPKLNSLKLSNLQHLDRSAPHPVQRRARAKWPLSLLEPGREDLLEYRKDSPTSQGPQLACLLEALPSTELKLRHLSFDALVPEDITWYTENVEEASRKDALGHLQSVQLLLVQSLSLEDPRKAWEQARLCDVLGASAWLEELRIHVGVHYGLSNQQLSFEHTFQGCLWSHLTRLDLDNFETEAVPLIEFLRAHAASLTVLRLADMTLLATGLPTWGSVFREMASSLHLHDARFTGRFLAERSGLSFDEFPIYRNMEDEVRGLGGVVILGPVLRTLLCSPYFRAPQGREECHDRNKEMVQARAGSGDVDARDRLLMRLFGVACLRLASEMSGVISLSESYAPTYSAAYQAFNN